MSENKKQEKTSEVAKESTSFKQAMSDPNIPPQVMEVMGKMGAHVSSMSASLTVQANNPLPAPEEFKKYSEISPRLADAFIDNLEAPRLRAQNEQKHRHEMEKMELQLKEKALIENSETLKRNTLLGTLVLVFAIVGSIACASLNMENASITLGSSAILAICAAFFNIKKTTSENKK